MLTLYFHHPYGSMLTLDGKICCRRAVKLDNGSETAAVVYQNDCAPCAAAIRLTRGSDLEVAPCSDGVKLLRCDASAAEIFFFPQQNVRRLAPKVLSQRSFYYSGGEHLVTIYDDGRLRLNIENADCLYAAELPETQGDISVNGDGNVFVIAQERAAEIVAFGGDYSSLLSVRGGSVEISEIGVTVTDEIDGMRKCRRILIYSGDGGGYTLKSADFKYENREYIRELSADLLAYYLDIGDFASAEEHLGDGIRGKELREFLGDYIDAERAYRPYRANCIEKLYDNGGELILKTFLLEYAEGKIVNITESD